MSEYDLMLLLADWLMFYTTMLSSKKLSHHDHHDHHSHIDKKKVDINNNNINNDNNIINSRSHEHNYITTTTKSNSIGNDYDKVYSYFDQNLPTVHDYELLLLAKQHAHDNSSYDSNSHDNSSYVDSKEMTINNNNNNNTNNNNNNNNDKKIKNTKYYVESNVFDNNDIRISKSDMITKSGYDRIHRILKRALKLLSDESSYRNEVMMMSIMMMICDDDDYSSTLFTVSCFLLYR